MTSARPIVSQQAVAAAQPWHAMPHEHVSAILETPPGGLAVEEAGHRLERHGPNSLPPPPRRSALRRFLAQFENFLLQILLGAVLMLMAIGHYSDAAFILAGMFVNALMDFGQERKGEHAIPATQHMSSHQATVSV